MERSPARRAEASGTSRPYLPWQGTASTRRRTKGWLAFAVGAIALAAPPARATLMNLTYALQMGALPPIVTTVTVNVATVSMAGRYTQVSIPAGVIAVGVVFPTSLFTPMPLLSGLTVVFSNQAGLFKTAMGGAPSGFDCAALGAAPDVCIEDGPGNLGGTMPLGGTAFLNVLGLFNVAVPLSVIGKGGTTTVIFGAHQARLQGAPWTEGTAQITAPNFVTTGTNVFPAPLRLVTPISMVVNPDFSGFATLTLTPVPEPGVGLLLVALAALAAREGVKRRR